MFTKILVWSILLLRNYAIYVATTRQTVEMNILNVWRHSIEEEFFLDFTKNSFIDVEAKNWSMDNFDRFEVTVKPIMALFSSVCAIVLVYQLTPTAVTIENTG
ncbi:MAG: hypothetical protein HEEMFOPI_02029 [Holosporales bacterium]